MLCCRRPWRSSGGGNAECCTFDDYLANSREDDFQKLTPRRPPRSSWYQFLRERPNPGERKEKETEIKSSVERRSFRLSTGPHSYARVFKKKEAKTEDLHKRSRAKRRPSFLNTTRPNFAATFHPCLRWSAREPNEGRRRYLFKVKKIFRMKRWNGAISHRYICSSSFAASIRVLLKNDRSVYVDQNTSLTSTTKSSSQSSKDLKGNLASTWEYLKNVQSTFDLVLRYEIL